MNGSQDNWFVEEFHLASPVEEFETFSRHEIDRLRSANPNLNDAAHRQAVDLVLRKLRGDGHGGQP